MLRGIVALVALALCLVAGRLHATVEQVKSPATQRGELWQTEPAHALEAALVEDAADGRLDRHTLLTATLIASGCVDADQLATHATPIKAWLDRLAVDPQSVNSQRERAERLLRRLHDELFIGRYQADCSDLRRLNKSGDFNCVGAAVMYLAACESAGLTAVPQEMPGHVRCRVWLDGEWIIVEPTCREWFTVMNDKSQMDRLDVAQELRAVWRDPSQGRVLNLPALVAMIYYNQGLDRLEMRDWPGAVSANQKALRLDPASRTARANLLAIWNNWALQLSERGEHAEAEEMLRRGLRIAPEFTTFQLNLGVVKQRQSEKP
jgi:tetratricopeptide (TPR) repeat protein